MGMIMMVEIARSSSCRRVRLILSLLVLVFFKTVSTFSPKTFFGTYHYPVAKQIALTRTSIRQNRYFALSASSKATSLSTTNVVYQKVVRPSKDLPDVLFLGYLVEYLESHFQLPAKLPMTYESLSCSEESRCILAWDSPLSPSPDATRMEVEVIGIYTGEEDVDENKRTDNNDTAETQRSVPTMAMVVVRKAKSTNSPLPPMMQNLFADSEKKIFRVLDRGLEDFIAGRIQFREDRETAQNSSLPNVKTAEQAIQAELVDELPSRGDKIHRKNPQNVVLDTSATVDTASETMNFSKKSRKTKSDKKVASKVTRNAALESMKVKAPPKNLSKKAMTSRGNRDFAVEAAMKAAKKRSGPSLDYAVAAAKRISTSRKRTKKKRKSTSTEKASVNSKTSNSRTKKTITTNATKPKKTLRILTKDNTKQSIGPNSFRTVISRPSERANKIGSKGEIGKTVSRKSGKAEVVNRKGDTPEKRPQESSSINPINTKRNVNVNIVESAVDEITSDKNLVPRQTLKTMENLQRNETDVSELKGKSKPPPSREQMERDIMMAAQDVMSDLAEQGQDMTPEELLQDVLKFDQDQAKENAEGSGFVSGAFEKAKELLREQHQQRETRLREKVVKQISNEISNLEPDIRQLDNKEMSPEEELKQMFTAGEKLADGRIAKAYSKQVEASSSEAVEKEIDALIAEERTISSHARVLDDELAELELRINKSPGEEFDGSIKSPIFDVFSGPELYNPNVDPETINFPGALPGTKDVRLPKELDEAVKQAKFATDVLTKLQLLDSKNEEGKTEVKYFLGERELSSLQVENLKTLVEEATEIGLIENPLNLMTERSSLQMILDELWDQPEERFHDIASNFKDLLLSDNFVMLVKDRLTTMADRDLDALRRGDESLEKQHTRERELLGQLVAYAQALLKEARALGAELEAQQLEVIRSICKVAMDPSHATEEDTAMALTDAVRDMRPLLDDAFVAYLKYAIAEEESRLARAGVLDDSEHNHWLFVLKVVQQGVHTEIARGINRYIEHIWYVLRMETSVERRMLLKKLIDAMPTLDVRPFVQVVDNIVGSLGDAAKGEFDGVTALGEMTNKLLQLHRDVKEFLPPERIALMSRDADEWAAKQKKKLLEGRKLTKQRLRAANDVAHLEGEIESLGRRGEMERID